MDAPAKALPGDTGSFYEKQVKIHAREVDGRFDRLRTVAVVVLLGLYYVLPWVLWGDRQAVLFDLPARRFYIFGFVFWPQDFFYLSWLLIMAALLLFFVTALVGRVWCGYACPQTVWTEIFVWMERLTEGSFQKRIKLDRGPWTREKVLRKGAKQVLWVGFSVWTGLTFVGYFTPMADLVARLGSFALGPWELFWIGFYGLATYGNAGFLREQVCKYMCPYARFQSAMFDRDTLVVSYDSARGDPRGGRRRGAANKPANLGDCTDCNLCVQVCPTGIDIRKGLQYECIACAACVDACDSVMDRMEYPRGLIRYTTEAALAGQKTRIFRPRTLIYGGLLAALFIGFVASLANRELLHVDVIRDRNALYRELPDGTVQNVYLLKVLNKTQLDRPVRVSVSGLPDAVAHMEPAAAVLAAGALATLVVHVDVPRDAAVPGGHDIVFTVAAVDGEVLSASRASRFFLPGARQP